MQPAGERPPQEGGGARESESYQFASACAATSALRDTIQDTVEDPPPHNSPTDSDADSAIDVDTDVLDLDEPLMRDPIADAEEAAIEHAIAERRRMSLSAVIFGVATFISRIAGTAREIVTAALFGVGTQLSAFTIAFQIPNLIRSLVADSALSGAFVPVFIELRENDETERAWRLAGTFITIIFMVLGPLSLLCGLFAPQVVSLFIEQGKLGAYGFDLTVMLMRIMLRDRRDLRAERPRRWYPQCQ